MKPISVIMVGAPRSGTYWLVDLLQSRFGLHFPSETHFIPLYSRYLWLWGDLSDASNRRRLLGSIYEFLQIWTARSSSSRDYLAQIRRLSLLVTLDEKCAENIVEESSDYPSLVTALFRHFAKVHGAQASGDKSAHYKVMDPDLTFGLFPEALMLHVIRDGRDVAMSWTKQWFGPATVREAARLWSGHVTVNREWGRRNPSRYLEIRYEDLATDREAEIAKLQSFLNTPASSENKEVSRSALAKALSNTESHSEMLDIVAAENVSKWQSEMSAEDVALFEKVAGATLAAGGYQVAVAGEMLPRIRFPQISPHVLRVAVKTILPLVLGICTCLGFSPLALINRRYPREWREVDMNQTGKSEDN
jgi:hypothetical protein